MAYPLDLVALPRTKTDTQGCNLVRTLGNTTWPGLFAPDVRSRSVVCIWSRCIPFGAGECSMSSKWLAVHFAPLSNRHRINLPIRQRNGHCYLLRLMGYDLRDRQGVRLSLWISICVRLRIFRVCGKWLRLQGILRAIRAFVLSIS